MPLAIVSSFQNKQCEIYIPYLRERTVLFTKGAQAFQGIPLLSSCSFVHVLLHNVFVFSQGVEFVSIFKQLSS